jgi:SAM-dependent methyltransferase
MPAVTSRELAFNQMTEFWRGKAGSRGDGYVGRLGEKHDIQTQRIEDILRMRLDPTTFFDEAIDFGCGWGRFIPFLSNYCGHIWAVDLLEDQALRAASSSAAVSSFTFRYPGQLPVSGPDIDFLWVCLVFQHIIDDEMLASICQELRRVLKGGARVMILDNAVDRASHVKPREPSIFADLLGLRKGWRADLVTINKRANDHRLIDGYVS